MAAATAAWDASGPAIEAGFRNGQCTDYVQRARPDVVRSYFIRMWAGRMLNPAFTYAADFDAYLWDDNARAAGLTVSDIPRPGAVMVLERGVQGASAEYGHVAIVTTTADPDGRFRVHQMNVGGPYVEGDGRYRRGAGVSFVL